jgi:hypothetical protein
VKEQARTFLSEEEALIKEEMKKLKEAFKAEDLQRKVFF